MIRYLTMSFVHNCVAHPLLLVADVLEIAQVPCLPDVFHRFHDWTGSVWPK